MRHFLVMTAFAVLAAVVLLVPDLRPGEGSHDGPGNEET